MPISATDLNKAYLAYFGRPADLTGKTYFATLEQADVIKAFDASAESKALYGNDAAAKVNAIYQNLFNRDAEPAGLVYWTTLINQGRVTAAGAAFAILNGAQGTDATAVQNKLAASDAFVAAMDTTAELVGYSGLDAAASARNWLKGVTSDAASLTAAVAGAQAAVNAAVAVGTGEGGAGYQLTNGTDVASSNVFTAGLVYTPGGDDRINSLQDEDRLTGTGTNATLNATLGNANDNGGTVITPTLNNIKTINAAFTGSGGGLGRVDTLDLQDATGVKEVNITRIADNQGAAVNNISSVPATGMVLSVKNSQAPSANVDFTFLASAVAGTTDVATLTLSNVAAGRVRVEQNSATPTQGFETINLVSTGSANTVGVLLAEDLQTLNISGTQNLNLGTRGATLNGQSAEAARYGDVFRNADGSLTKIDASAFEGNLDLTLGSVFNAGADNTSGVNVKFDLIAGKGNDTIRLTEGTVVGGTEATRDNINGGEGNNTLVVVGNTTIAAAGTAAAPVANVTNIQALEVRTGHDDNVVADAATINADAFDKLATIYVRNEGQDFGYFNAGVFVPGAAPAGFTSAWHSRAEGMTVNLNNLTAAQGAAITIAHGTTGNNGIAQNTLNANLKSSTNASDTVGVTIVNGVNTDGRFNFSLTTNADLPATATVERVENITLTDSDTESNTVFLASAVTHTGTITLTGGRAGDFINLDTDGTSLTGLQGRNTTSATAPVDITGWQDVGTAGVVRLTAATINAAAELANVTVRVSTTAANTNGGQSITMGSGNDVVIFDDIAATSATRAQAGLTNADTVVGGEGADTLVLDGNGVNVVIQQSEWDNVSGFETVYLAGNVAGNQYFIQIDNDMIAANGVSGNMITIDNDNDSLVNTQVNEFFIGAANADNNASNTAVRLDATTLSANMHFTYDGEEGVGATADRFVVNDQNTNGGNVIDGGDVTVSVTVDPTTGVLRQSAGVRSNDVLEVRNTATVTTADLNNVRNVGNIVINNDQAVQQTLNLTLNSAVVDALSDSGHTASLTEIETLVITANDGAMTDAAGTGLIPVAVSRIVLDARSVGGAFGLTVNGDNLAGGAADVVQMGINLGGATSTFNLAAGADTLSFSGSANGVIVRDSTAVGAPVGQDEILFSDATATATQIQRVTGTETINFSNVTIASNTITVAALDGASTITTVIGNATTGTTINAAAAVVGLTLTGGAGADVITGGAGADVITGGAGADVITGGAGADNITAGEGTDTVTIGDGQDTVSLTETTAVADTLVWSTAFATGNANAATVTGFAFGAGADLIDINVAVLNGTTNIAAGTGATNTLAALAPVAVASNGTATVNDVIFTFNGAGDLLAAGTTVANAVANAVTALTSGTDFSSANIATGDSLILQMNDGTNTFVFHYVADATAATTAATDLALIGVFSGTTVQALTGDFI